METLNIKRLQPDPAQGLSRHEVDERVRLGLSNADAGIKTKSIGEIVGEHFFTFFNILNAAIAIFVLSTGSFKNALFLGVVVSNLVIGIAQEIRAKKIIDELSVLASPKARVIRDGKAAQIQVEELVLDDILLLRAGEQICADSIVLDGDCEVNESLLTGESDAVIKHPGDLLYSGSFVVSGTCRSRVEHIGGDNYANRISNDSKYIKQAKSELMESINRIIAFFGGCVIPIGMLLFAKEFFINHVGYQQAVISAAASMIGMIPEGLVLLTSAVLAVSVIRLSKFKTLVHDLYCIEALARVDVLCVDKTGTITEGSLKVDELLPASGETESSLRHAIGLLMGALEDVNPTAEALRAACETLTSQADDRHPFSSARKWSGAHFDGEGSFVLGAAEIIGVGSGFENILARSTQNGQRVLAVAHTNAPFIGNELPSGLQCVGLVIMSDVIRHGAEETFAYFRDEGVEVKVISGDHPVAVSRIAQRAGLLGADQCVDARTLDTDEKLAQAAEQYTVFGRVTPQQKLALVKALKANGHTVAMTGDGVNDVLALKESDCSIAMAAGSDAARTVSNLVLLDSDFSAMPIIVQEGRRAINNLQRSASLFIVKNILTIIISVVTLLAPFSYPFQPIQFSLISMATIGIPSFLLALEINRDPLKGSFFVNVVTRALPASLCVSMNVLALGFLSDILGLTFAQTSTLSVFITAFTGFIMLFRICMPFTVMRGTMCTLLVTLFLTVSIFFRDLVALVPFTGHMWIVFACMAVIVCSVFPLLIWLTEQYLKPFLLKKYNK